MPKARGYTKQNIEDVTSQIDNVSSSFKQQINAITKILNGYSYNQTKVIIKEVRKKLNLLPEKAHKRLPTLLSRDEVKAIFERAGDANPVHCTMLKLLYYSGLRVSELCNITVSQVYWKECFLKITGKGNKDRIVLYPQQMKDEVRSFMFSNKGNEKQPQQFIFLSKKNTPFNRASVHRFLNTYAVDAGVKKNVYPHLLRHHHLTELTGAGLNEKQIMIQSGHSSKYVLEIYQHLHGLDRKSYDKAVVYI